VRAPAKLALALEIAAVYVRVRLWTLSEGDIRRVLAKARAAPDAAPAARDPALARRLGRAVHRVLVFPPRRSRCLLQSLVLTRLLARRGIASAFVIGVAPGAEFLGHAWVESDGVPLLPTREGTYRRLVRL